MNGVGGRNCGFKKRFVSYTQKSKNEQPTVSIVALLHKVLKDPESFYLVSESMISIPREWFPPG